MNPNKVQVRIILISMLLPFLIGCGLFQATTSTISRDTPEPPEATSTSPPPTFTSTPPPLTTTLTSPPPTASPTPIPPSKTPTPSTIPGIDEPIIVEGISVKNSMGLTVKEDLELQILDAYTRESQGSGDSGPIYPDDRSNVFLTLMLSPKLSVTLVEWVALNAVFACGSETYQPESTGIKIESGRLESMMITYVVPGDGDFSECKLQLPDGQEIPIATFFEAETSRTNQVVLIPHPECSQPLITSGDEIIVRVRWGATTPELAESNADHFIFVFLLDGQEFDDIRPYRQPAETYSGYEAYGCGPDQPVSWVHWDVPIGQLAAGTHTVAVEHILDEPVSDGFDSYPAGSLGLLKTIFEVQP